MFETKREDWNKCLNNKIYSPKINLSQLRISKDSHFFDSDFRKSMSGPLFHEETIQKLITTTSHQYMYLLQTKKIQDK